MLEEAERKVEALERSANALRRELERVEEEEFDGGTLRERLRGFPDQWKRLAPPDKKDLLRSVVARIEVDPDGMVVELHDGKTRTLKKKPASAGTPVCFSGVVGLRQQDSNL